MGILYKDEIWMPCLKIIHPAWLLPFKITSFIVFGCVSCPHSCGRSFPNVVGQIQTAPMTLSSFFVKWQIQIKFYILTVVILCLLQMIQNVQDSIFSTPRVKLAFQLGSEAFSVDSKTGNLSQLLSAMKEESMNILKEYITKLNVLDESVNASSEEEEEEEESTEEIKEAFLFPYKRRLIKPVDEQSSSAHILHPLASLINLSLQSSDP